MDEIIENEVRERVCEENWQRMRTVKNNFTKTRIYNFYLGIPMVICSWIFLTGWIMQTGTGIRKSLTMMAEDPEPVYFPWHGVTAFIVPLIVLLTFLTENKPKWICNALAFLLHFLIFAFGVSNLILRFEPMKYFDMIFLAVYGFLGMWSQDFALRSYKELDYLVTQEGYPDFNFNLEKGRYSRYVKYRNSWLKKQKQLDYFTPSEQPVGKPITVRTESETKMEGIGVSETDQSEWFTQKETAAAEVPPAPAVIFDPVPKPEIADGEPVGEMGALQTEGEGIIPDELYDDPRRRPL
ncbi:MAG: hypothetical protein K2N72_03430 [Oscillospiraceae bacterium]|nr:hypothetical protein [Oscillospiraceae bacterium]